MQYMSLSWQCTNLHHLGLFLLAYSLTINTGGRNFVIQWRWHKPTLRPLFPQIYGSPNNLYTTLLNLTLTLQQRFSLILSFTLVLYLYHTFSPAENFLWRRMPLKINYLTFISAFYSAPHTVRKAKEKWGVKEHCHSNIFTWLWICCNIV